MDHVLRKDGNCIEKEIIQGTKANIDGALSHDNIMKWIGLSGDNSLLRSVEDRTQWRKIVHEAAYEED